MSFSAESDPKKRAAQSLFSLLWLLLYRIQWGPSAETNCNRDRHKDWTSKLHRIVPNDKRLQCHFWYVVVVVDVSNDPVLRVIYVGSVVKPWHSGGAIISLSRSSSIKIFDEFLLRVSRGGVFFVYANLGSQLAILNLRYVYSEDWRKKLQSKSVITNVVIMNTRIKKIFQF